MNSRIQAVDSNVLCIPSVPTRHRLVADFPNLGVVSGIVRNA